MIMILDNGIELKQVESLEAFGYPTEDVELNKCYVMPIKESTTIFYYLFSYICKSDNIRKYKVLRDGIKVVGDIDEMVWLKVDDNKMFTELTQAESAILKDFNNIRNDIFETYNPETRAPYGKDVA